MWSSTRGRRSVVPRSVRAGSCAPLTYLTTATGQNFEHHKPDPKAWMSKDKPGFERRQRRVGVDSTRRRSSEGSARIWPCSATIGCSRRAGAAQLGASDRPSRDRPDSARESPRPSRRVRDGRIRCGGTDQVAPHEIWNIDWVEHGSSLAVSDGGGAVEVAARHRFPEQVHHAPLAVVSVGFGVRSPTEARYVAGIATGPRRSSRFQVRTSSVRADLSSSARLPAAAIAFNVGP